MIIVFFQIQNVNADVGILSDLIWAVVVEDKNHSNSLITEPMHYSLMKGHFEKVPILIGFNSEECILFAPSKYLE